MIFKNTFKLLFSNFSLTYKTFIYKLIILLLALGLAGTIATPFLMHLVEIDFFSYVVNQFALMVQNINIGNIFIGFRNIFLEIATIFQSLNTELLINAIISICSFFVVYGLLGGVSELAVIDCLNSSLSSKTKLSFFKSLISKIFKSFLMTIIKFVLSIPYIICVYLIFHFGFISYAQFGSLGLILVPMLMFIVFILITSIHLSLITGFSPSIIVNDEGVFKSLFIGFKAIKKKYFKVLSTSLMICLSLAILNLFVAVFSFFAGLIITIPISYVVVCLFKIVSYYECNGMRYYVGENIRTPLKKCEQDKIKKLKYIV